MPGAGAGLLDHQAGRPVGGRELQRDRRDDRHQEAPGRPGDRGARDGAAARRGAAASRRTRRRGHRPADRDAGTRRAPWPRRASTAGHRDGGPPAPADRDARADGQRTEQPDRRADAVAPRSAPPTPCCPWCSGEPGLRGADRDVAADRHDDHPAQAPGQRRAPRPGRVAPSGDAARTASSDRGRADPRRARAAAWRTPRAIAADGHRGPVQPGLRVADAELVGEQRDARVEAVEQPAPHARTVRRAHGDRSRGAAVARARPVRRVVARTWARRPEDVRCRRPSPRRPGTRQSDRSATRRAANWLAYSRAYAPPAASSSSCEPCSTIAPCSMTRIESASRMVDSRCAMTNDVRPCAQRVHRLLDEHLGAGVHRRRRLVEDEDRRVGQERAGDGQQLLLPRARRSRPRRRSRCRSRRAASARTGRRAWPRAAATISLLRRARRRRRRCSPRWSRRTARCPAAPCRSASAASSRSGRGCRRRRA